MMRLRALRCHVWPPRSPSRIRDMAGPPDPEPRPPSACVRFVPAVQPREGLARRLRSPEDTMMRITEISRSESVCRFRLEGRLTQLTTAELVTEVEPFLVAGGTVLLDLAGVSFADPAGVETLLALRGGGVVLFACSSFPSEMLRVDPRAGCRPETT